MAIRAIAWKRAMVRAARAMPMATRVAGEKKKGKGVEAGNEDEEGDGEGGVSGG